MSFLCENGRQTISLKKLMDGVPHCSDGSGKFIHISYFIPFHPHHTQYNTHTHTHIKYFFFQMKKCGVSSTALKGNV